MAVVPVMAAITLRDLSVVANVTWVSRDCVGLLD